MRDPEVSDDPRARQAIDYFVFRTRREIGAMAAVLKGLDAIGFCGGIGENSSMIRQATLEAMEWVGVELDLNRNGSGAASSRPTDPAFGSLSSGSTRSG